MIRVQSCGGRDEKDVRKLERAVEGGHARYFLTNRNKAQRVQALTLREVLKELGGVDFVDQDD